MWVWLTSGAGVPARVLSGRLIDHHSTECDHGSVPWGLQARGERSMGKQLVTHHSCFLLRRQTYKLYMSCTSTYADTHTHMYTHTHILHIHSYIHTHIHTCIHTHTHTYIHTHACTHTVLCSKYSKKAFFSNSALSEAPSMDKRDDTIGGIPCIGTVVGVASREEEEGRVVGCARPPPIDWEAMETTP